MRKCTATKLAICIVSERRAQCCEQSLKNAELTEEAMNVEGELLLRVGHSEAFVGEAEHAGVVVVQDEHRGRARVRERGQALLVQVLVRVIGLQTVVVVLERYHRRYRVIITTMEKTSRR